MYAGFDKIFILNDSQFKYKTGDIIQNSEGFYFLVLGNEISFPEIYNTLYTSDTKFTIIYKSLLSEKSIELIHRMVYNRYTTYKNVIKFFLDTDIEKLILKKIKPNKKEKSFKIKIGKKEITGNGEGQTLIVFPDIRTYTNIIGEKKSEGIFLYSLDTQNIKNTNRWKIKTGNENLIYTTSSEIFQDYKDLTEIYFIEPQKWYYASQQDPRYKVGTVLEKIGKLYNAKIRILNTENI